MGYSKQDQAKINSLDRVSLCLRLNLASCNQNTTICITNSESSKQMSKSKANSLDQIEKARIKMKFKDSYP